MMKAGLLAAMLLFTALGGAHGATGDECDSSKTWYNMVTTFSYVGALIAIVGIGA